MRVGDCVTYKNNKAEIIEVKWGLYRIKFVETRKEIWVNCDALEKYDF